MTESGENTASLSGAFKHTLKAASEMPCTGDFVLVKTAPHSQPQIQRVLRRKTAFSRPNSAARARKAAFVESSDEQMLAANFDYVIMIQSLNQNFNVNRLERYASITRNSGAEAVVVLSKADLADNIAPYTEMAAKAVLGADVIALSAHTGQGIDVFGKYLKPGKTLVFLGSSGVGKSSLLNALAGKELMEIREINEGLGKGRHTTTHRQLLRLECGVMIIDTPGIREIGLWEVSGGVSATFADIEEIAVDCRFTNCAHSGEPGCAVDEAVRAGLVTRKRVNNYSKLKQESGPRRRK